ncbi:MAG: ATP synthase F1 subunit delta [Bilophila sp.]
MKGDIVAQRYAHALFALGKEQGMDSLESYGKALTELVQTLGETPELARLFCAPVISIAEKKNVLRQLLDAFSADPMVKNFCFLLADKERLSSLEAIAVCYGKLLDEARGIVRGRLLTATELSAKRQAGILATLEKRTSKQLALRFEVEPSILGGVVIQVGDRVFDASLRAQLTILRDIIKRGE